ncbi:hypothetical protein BDV18DRAFT_143451 [Aspergillus unguis]
MGRPRDIESDIEAENGRLGCRLWARLIVWCILSYMCMLVIFIRACFPEFSLLRQGLLTSFVQRSSPAFFYAFSQSPRHFDKPKDIEIVALVPFHDSSRTEILDCYLQRNLASSGGFLDRVVFMPQKNHTESLGWLASRVAGTPSYAISATGDISLETAGGDMNTLFVLIDGDIVFLEYHLIPTMVRTKLDRPDVQVVSANVINQAALAHLHIHPSIALPYLPELQRENSVDRDSWRASALPRWQGPARYQVRKGFSRLSGSHRWLPTDDEAFDLTPIGRYFSSDDGPELHEWTVKAQQHYSFLHHLELGDLNRYKFPIWNNPESISASFFCFMGSDAETVELFMSHEAHDTTLNSDEIESRRAKQFIVDGKGLAVQYNTDQRSRGLDDTDVLQRYRLYAQEMVCE